MSRIGVPAVEAHVLEGPRGRVARRRVGEGVGVGDRAVDRDRPGRGWCPRMTCGASAAASMHDLLVERGAVVGGQRRASRRAPASHAAPFGRVGPALEVGERRVVGGDQAGLGAGLDRHVAHGHAALHRQRPDGRAAVLDDVSRCRRRCRCGR